MALGIILFLYGLFFTNVNAFLVSFRKTAAGKTVIIAVTVILAGILSLAVASIISMARAGSEKPAENATVVVLGCHVYDTGISRSLKSRLDTAKEYLDENPDSKCVVCGGKGHNEPSTEGEAMYEYLVEKGIDKDRIFMDITSTDTLENLHNAKAIIEENGLNPQTVIISNDYHIYRALAYAKNAGFDSPSGIPAPTLWWLFPSITIREMYGIMEMWFINHII